MTMPYERYNSIRYTEKFLLDLCDPKKTPRVPKDVRGMARMCLRHYPSTFHLDMLSTRSPDVLETGNKIDELSMLMHDYETRKNNGSTN